ncbi:uncharacterized protein JCM10292_004771 [Rhodotorula paludigena]|uniref:uncharacterized protein n=1 Tax=Rhodotorula paludigena TaxID=86838 RepID=UPI00316C7A52
MPPLFEPESDYDPSDLSSGDEGEGEDVVSLHQGLTAPGNAEPGIVPPSLLAHLAPTTAQSVVGSLVSLKAKQVEPRTKKAQRDSDYRHSFGNALSQGLYDPTAFLAEPVSHPPALSPPSHKMALLPRRSDFFDVDHLLPLVASDNPTSPLPSFDPSLAPSVLSRRVDAAIAGAGAFASLLSPSVPLGNYVVVYEDLSPRGRKEMQERLERTEVSGDLFEPEWDPSTAKFGSVADKVPFLQRLEPGQVVLGADMHSPARFHTSHAYHTISSLESLVSASPGTRSAALATTVIEAQSRLTDLTSLRRFPRPALSLRKSPAAEDSQLLSWLEILELVNPKGNLKGGHSHTIGVSRHNSGSGLIAVPALLASWAKTDERNDPSKHTVLIPLGLLPPGSHPGTVHHLQSGSYAEYDVDDIGFFVFRGVDSHVASSHKLPPSYTVDPRYAVSRSMAVAYPYALANTPDPPLATDLERLVLRQDFAQAGPTSLPFLSLAPSSAALGGEDVRLYLLLRARVRERFLGAHSRRTTSRYSTGRLLPSDAAQFEALMREELEETQHQEIEFVAHARATHKRSVQKTGSVSHRGESYVVSRGFVPTSATIRFKKGKFCARKRGWRFDPHLPVLAPVPPLGTPAEEALYPLHLLALRHQYPPSELARLRHDYQALASLSAAPLPPLPPQPLPPVHSESPDEESPPFSLSSSGRLFIKTVPLCVRPPDSRINKSDIPSGSCSDAAPKRPAASDATHSTAPLPLSTRLAELLLADILDAPRSNVYSAGFADSLSSLVSRGALVHDMLALPTLGAGEPAAVLLDAVAQLAPRSREAFRLGDLDKAAMRLDCALELLALSRTASIVVSVDTALTQHSGDLALAGLSPECIAAVHAHLAKGVHDAPSAFSFAALVPPPSIPTMESPPFVLVAPTGAPSHPDHPGHARRARLLILDLLILFLAAPSAHLDASTCDALASDEAARQASCSMQLLPRLHARLYLARALHRAFGSGAVFLVPASHELVFEPRRYSRDSQRSASHGERFAANEAGSWALAFDAVAARSEVDAALASLVEAHCEAGAPGGFSALWRMPCGGKDGSHVWPLWQPEKLGAVAMDAPGGQKKLLKKAKAKKTSAADDPFVTPRTSDEGPPAWLNLDLEQVEADKKKRVKQIRAIDAARGVGPENAALWLNVFLLACCVDVGVVEQESDWFGGDQAATALFQQIFKQIHSFPDKYSFARDHSPARLLWQKELLDPDVPPWRKVALVSTIRGTLIGSSPSTYSHFSTPPANIWDLETTLRSDPVRPLLTTTDAHGSLGSINAYGAPTDISPSHLAHFWHGAPHFARVAGLPATQQAPRPSFSSVLSIFRHLWIAPSGAPVLAHNGEAPGPAPVDRSGVPLAAIAKTAADVRLLRKEAPVPVWTPEQPVPDSFEGFTIYPKDLVGHETHEVGNFAAFPQIRGGLTSTLTVSDLASIDVVAMPTKQDFADLIFSIARGGFRGIVQLGFVDAYGEDAFERFIEVMRSRWSEGGLHSDVKKALAYHGIFMDLLHLEHLSCKIGRPDFDKFKKDAVFAKLLNLAPRLLNLDGPLWRAVQQRAAAARQ